MCVCVRVVNRAQLIGVAFSLCACVCVPVCVLPCLRACSQSSTADRRCLLSVCVWPIERSLSLLLSAAGKLSARAHMKGFIRGPNAPFLTRDSSKTITATEIWIWGE